jgi:hypothetical protein
LAITNSSYSNQKIDKTIIYNKKHSSIKLPIFFKTRSCSLVNSQTNFGDVSMYLKFGHRSITLIMSVPNDGYFRNASCAPNLISTFKPNGLNMVAENRPRLPMLEGGERSFLLII